MTEWYRFNCLCPGCGRGEPTNWYHSEECCCSANGWLYINSECKIKCDECYNRKNQSPSFVLCWRFKCSRHQGEYKDANKFSVLSAISYICTNNNIPEDVRTQMIDIVNHYKY